MKRKLKIGFDFDGVLAYNPVRILRLPVSLLTRWFLRKESLSYLSYYPKTGMEKFFWKILNWASFFPALGFPQLKKLLRMGKIEGYIISGRFAILEDSLEKWLAKHGAENLFDGCYVNKNNEPPHLFKERMIKKLKLDMFVEDNWDIVQYLNRKSQRVSESMSQRVSESISHKSTDSLTQASPAKSGASVDSLTHFNCEIHWIYNILDRFKPYKNKHPYLKKFLEAFYEGRTSVKGRRDSES